MLRYCASRLLNLTKNEGSPFAVVNAFINKAPDCLLKRVSPCRGFDAAPVKPKKKPADTALDDLLNAGLAKAKKK